MQATPYNPTCSTGKHTDGAWQKADIIKAVQHAHRHVTAGQKSTGLESTWQDSTHPRMGEHVFGQHACRHKAGQESTCLGRWGGHQVLSAPQTIVCYGQAAQAVIPVNVDPRVVQDQIRSEIPEGIS